MALSDISKIDLSQDEQARIMSAGLKQSAVYQLLAAQGNVVPTSSLKDKLVHSFTYGDAAFHNPIFDDLKSVSKVNDKPIEVQMVNEYYIFKVPDFTADEYPGLIEQIKTELPLVLGQTLDRAVFGTEFIPSSKFSGIGKSATVDNTAATWQAAAEAPSVDATGWIISNSQKSNVRAAVTAGSTVNPLTFGLNDGFQLAGMPAYFRDLPANTEHKTVGLVGDFRRAVLYVKDGIEFTVYSPETSFELARENAVAIKASWRIGFAAANNALVELVTE